MPTYYRIIRLLVDLAIAPLIHPRRETAPAKKHRYEIVGVKRNQPGHVIGMPKWIQDDLIREDKQKSSNDIINF